MKVSVGYDSNASAAPSSSSPPATKLQNSGTRLKKKATKKEPKKLKEEQTKALSSYPKWHNFVAGAAAGAGARFFTAPLDLIKIRQQLVKPALKAGGSTGAGVGASAAINGAASATASFSPLGLFQSLRDIVRNEGGLPSLFRGNLAATVRERVVDVDFLYFYLSFPIELIDIFIYSFLLHFFICEWNF